MEILRVEQLTKVYGTGDSAVRALDGVSFSVEKGEFIAIIGPSGSGKSTLLHILGGVDTPTSGKVYMDGQDVYAQSEDQLAVFRRRQVGLIYQFYNLIPVLDVQENITLPVLMDGRKVNEERLEELLATLKLKGRERHLPNQLSGGQQQRVALARAIVTRPKVLLLDEPLSAIDAKLRKNLQSEIRRIQKQLNITTIFVTHDQDEAMVMSDRICLLNGGKIEQMDTPIAIYTHPRTKFAAGFIGSYNVLEPLEFGRVTGDIDLPAQPIAIRPEVLNIAREKQGLPGTYDIQGTVIDSTPRGNVLRYKVEVNGVQLAADTLFRSFSIYENGSKVWLSLEKRNCLQVEEAV